MHDALRVVPTKPILRSLRHHIGLHDRLQVIHDVGRPHAGCCNEDEQRGWLVFHAGLELFKRAQQELGRAGELGIRQIVRTVLCAFAMQVRPTQQALAYVGGERTIIARKISMPST